MKGVILVILIFLIGTVVSLPYHSSRRLLNDVGSSSALQVTYEPPKANKVKHEMEMFGDVRTDNYYWLRDDSRSDPHVLAYLQEENNYTDLIMSDTKHLQDQIYAEIRGRIKEDDMTTPRRSGPYYYYEKTVAGLEYAQYCRRLAPNGGRDEPSVFDVMPTGPESSPEHIIVDANLRAQGHKYYRIGSLHVSPNHKLVAYTEDTRGDEIYTVNVIDADNRKPAEKSLVGLARNVVWAGNDSLLYITMDATHRPEKVWLHKLGEEQSNDLCIYHEKNDKFSVDIEASSSKEFVFVGSESINTRSIFYFDIANPEHGLIPLTPRLDGIWTSVSHRGTHFFIQMTNDEFYNSKLVACPVDNVSAITVIQPHRKSVEIQFVELFSDHLVLFERENYLTKVTIFNLPPVGEPIQILQGGHPIAFMDRVYAVYPADSEFYSSILRYTYMTLRTPQTVFDYEMNTRTAVIKKIETILGGFNSSNYITERLWATAYDGIQVPMSVVYRKDLVKLDGLNPLLLHGYGAFGAYEDPIFPTSKLPLLDRGFIYVIAHVRGGGEKGLKWWESGKLLNKKNTFTDFISCAEYLIEMKYSTEEKLVIEGRGPGGLIMGAVINMRPDLFKAVIAKVPFVDVLTTMLDPTIPRTTSEWEEWGDPRKEEFYFYMKSYSPVDNVMAQKYPSILVTAGLNDPDILYSQPAKFVAKMRELKTDDNMLLFKCDFSGGRFGKSGRSEWSKEEAFIFTFILKALNMMT